MPGPSRYNRKLKAKNDARKARSGGGRTRSEAAFGRSQRAAGRAVSRTNTRVPKKNRPARVRQPQKLRASRTPLALPQVQTAIERLRQKYGSKTLDRGNREARQVNTEVSQKRDRAERKLENAALRSLPTRGEALKAAPAVRQSTGLNAEGTRVERLAGATQVGNEPLRVVMGAAQRGRIKRRGDEFTTPRVRRTERKVRRAKREVRKAKAATRTPRKNLMRAGLDAEQAKVLSTVLRIGRKQGASKKEMLAAVETALVESNIRNLGYGDADSSGWRQERAMYYPNPQNVKASAGRFFQETAEQGRGAGMTAGQLAQAVQRSAFPDKYDERKADAVPLLRAFNSAGNASRKAKARLNRAKAKAGRLERVAAELGLSPNRERQRGPVRWGPKKAKQISGAWAGTEAILGRAGRGFSISSRKRDASHYLSQQNPSSDHNTANTNAYAHDIPAVGDENGIPIAEAYHKRLGLNEPLAIGTYNYYTSRKYPGYRFQILWNVSGHYDHVHVGARWTGEDLPAGTYAGGGGSTYSSGASGGSYVAAGGGGSAPAGPSADARRGGKKKDEPTAAEMLRKLGFRVTASGVQFPTSSGTTSSSDLDSTLTALRRKYKV